MTLDLASATPPSGIAPSEPRRGWQVFGYRAAALWAVLALAAALRIYGLVREGAWADEITTLIVADPSHSFREFWNLVLSDVHPPLYYLLMRGWCAVFGQSDLVARLPSVFFGVLTVGAATFAFPPQRFGARLALALLLALSPGAIEYSQEARSYSLLLFLSMVVTAACLRAASSADEGSAGCNRSILLLIFAGILASYTHYFGFLIASAAAAVACIVARGGARRLARGGLALIIVSFLPWVIYHAHYMSYGRAASAWIGTFPASATAAWFLRLWLSGPLAFIGVSLITAVLLPRRDFRGFLARDVTWRVGLAMGALTLAAALAVSWYTPILTSRNLIVILPGLYLAVAAIVSYGLFRWGVAITGACFALVLLLMAESLPWYYTAPAKEQWRASANLVLAQPGCAEGPIYVFGDGANYRYLLEQQRPHLKLVEVPVDRGALPSLPPLASDCSVLLWAADLSKAQFDSVMSALAVAPSCSRVASFYWAFVALRDPTSDACSGRRAAPATEALVSTVGTGRSSPRVDGSSADAGERGAKFRSLR